MSRPRAHWLALFEARDIPCGPINNYAEVMADPHILARELVVETDHPTLGRIKTLGTPLKLSDTPLTPGRPAPLLGQQVDEKLAQAVTADCMAQGVIIGVTNRSVPGFNNTLCLSPALIATPDDIDEITAAIDTALTKVFN